MGLRLTVAEATELALDGLGAAERIGESTTGDERLDDDGVWTRAPAPLGEELLLELEEGSKSESFGSSGSGVDDLATEDRERDEWVE